MKRIAIMLMFSALILFALEFKTTEHVKAEDDDWIVYMTNDLDSLQRDSIGSIVTDRIRDSIAALEHRTLEDLDSASIALRLASRDSAEQVWKDSTGQANVVILNDLTVHSELTVDNTITTGDTFILPEGGYFESIGADTTAVVDAVFKATNALYVQNGLYFGNGTSIVPSSATETVLSGVDKFYLRSQAIINPHWPTSPTSTVIGEGAGAVGMTGVNNVFVGNYSGYSNTTGFYNTFNGYRSGNTNTTGSYNTFNGSYSGYSNTAGYSNTFNGYYSGYSNTTGFYNTFSGAASGRNNTTGYNNTAIGDSSAWNMTEGNRNVVLGSKAALRNATDSDKFIVGQGVWSGATLNQSYLIEGDYTTGIVTINNVLTLTPITTANRPATPAEGMMYMDSTVDSLKIYINSKWFNINMTEE